MFLFQDGLLIVKVDKNAFESNGKFTSRFLCVLNIKMQQGNTNDMNQSCTILSPRRPNNYWTLYQTLPWYVFAYIIIFIVIYNVYNPNLERLSYLMIDTDNVKQAWRIYTHVFLHADPVHLTSNCITISFLTVMLGTAQHLQQWRIMILYTLAILQGGCGIGWEKRLAYPEKRFLAVGASGSAYGLLGMNTADIIINWYTMPLKWLRLFIVSFFICFELVAWFHLYSDSVSCSGHLGGFLGGLIGGPCLLINVQEMLSQRQREKEKEKEEKKEERRENRIEVNLSNEDNQDNENNDIEINRKYVNKHEKWMNFTRVLKITSYVLYPLYTVTGLINFFTFEA